MFLKIRRGGINMGILTKEKNYLRSLPTSTLKKRYYKMNDWGRGQARKIFKERKVKKKDLPYKRKTATRKSGGYGFDFGLSMPSRWY